MERIEGMERITSLDNEHRDGIFGFIFVVTLIFLDTIIEICKIYLFRKNYVRKKRKC